MKLVNIGIPVSVLAKLIYEGQVCAADIQCLDADSKQQLWQLCLWACKQRVGCSKKAVLSTKNGETFNKMLPHDTSSATGIASGEPLAGVPMSFVNECSNCCNDCKTLADKTEPVHKV
ncbi:hypothetical protein [Shewanella litorisediminis]|uniref:Uncharacterized protein n=1 Tax=Shewanella litorisediminis TaxID=1173586 RepID=A0ABX7G979_9GAMM|nr:hypothetical protein [Shewanella litorisediminis]MCL2919341.1 hypothetical protein [Shewanella litorisediminis]QRH03733.1 hypothetical protein JQC75_09025 [Shewanella litorisediminis]